MHLLHHWMISHHFHLLQELLQMLVQWWIYWVEFPPARQQVVYHVYNLGIIIILNIVEVLIPPPFLILNRKQWTSLPVCNCFWEQLLEVDIQFLKTTRKPTNNSYPSYLYKFVLQYIYRFCFPGCSPQGMPNANQHAAVLNCLHEIAKIIIIAITITSIVGYEFTAFFIYLSYVKRVIWIYRFFIFKCILLTWGSLLYNLFWLSSSHSIFYI